MNEEPEFVTARELHHELGEVKRTVTKLAHMTEKRFGRNEKGLLVVGLLTLVPKLAGSSAPSLITHAASILIHHVA